MTKVFCDDGHWFDKDAATVLAEVRIPPAVGQVCERLYKTAQGGYVLAELGVVPTATTSTMYGANQTTYGRFEAYDPPQYYHYTEREAREWLLHHPSAHNLTGTEFEKGEI